MKRQKNIKKIFFYLLMGIICMISLAIMAFVLWINFKNRLD